MVGVSVGRALVMASRSFCGPWMWVLLWDASSWTSFSFGLGVAAVVVVAALPPSSLQAASSSTAPMSPAAICRLTAVPLCIPPEVGNTPTYAESHLERVHQLRAG